MGERVYIETTVVSYFVSRPNRDVVVAGHQEATRELWPKLASEYVRCPKKDGHLGERHNGGS